MSIHQIAVNQLIGDLLLHDSTSAAIETVPDLAQLERVP
jgi:hypothetical protein